MSLDSIKKPEIKIKFNGEEWGVRFTLRNFAALEETYGIKEDVVLKGLVKGDIRMIPFAIWTATLVFAPFDPAEPLKIKKQIPLEELYELEMGDIKKITDDVIKAMESFLPKQKAPEGGAKKKQTKKSSK